MLCMNNVHKCTTSPSAHRLRAEQMWKIHLCGQLVDAWEAKRGMRFDWLLKWRSDIMLLQPFLQLPIQPPQNQFVYVNTNTRDHLFPAQGTYATDSFMMRHILTSTVLRVRRLDFRTIESLLWATCVPV